MTREIEIAWPTLDLSVTARLDERNPALAGALWSALPYRTLQGHALVAGHHLFHVAPIHELLHLHGQHRVDRRTVPDGTVFCSRLQHLGIKYGELTEPMPATPVGQVVPEDMEALAAAGAAIWDAVYTGKEPIRAEVRRADGAEPPGAGHGIPRLAASDPRVDELVGDLHAETERIWVRAPAELLDLHAGRIASGAGSYGTTLTTMLFVNGETRPLGYNVYGGLVRAASQGMPLESLLQMARILGAVPAEFLAYCGLRQLGEFTDRLLDCLQRMTSDREGSRDDFIALTAHMALYLNCLGGWNLQLFPWDIGDHRRAASAASAASGGRASASPTGRAGGRASVPRQAGKQSDEESPV
ncbi:cucumopine synthase-related protein [Actinomadura logoneensis]|uniref:cucumopine synthase-related protein n=1 Tax=Actinomadura logoneensis TaxID=2293572 RepID=UPI001314574C|nr:hypothetical protein [Actinomadura logoneensis]